MLYKNGDCNVFMQWQCKRLVFEYAPVILVNAEQFLEKNDVCTMLHVCDSTTAVDTKEISASMHAEA